MDIEPEEQTRGQEEILLLKVKKLFDQLIPSHWPADYAAQSKAFNLMGLIAGYTLLMTLYVPVYFWQGAAYAAWASIFCLCVQFALVYAMRHGAGFDLISYGTLSNVFITSASTLWLQGTGADGPQGVWIAFTPFAAAFITGVRQAIATLLLSVAFLLAVIWLKWTHSQFFYIAPVPDTVTMNTIHTLLLLLGFSLLGLSFLASQTLNERAMTRARQKADKLSQAKSEFLANMSHEIRTPMNAIVGMSYLVLQTELGTKQRNQVERVHRAAQSLLGIINDILDFSKIEAGKLAMESIDFSLDDILDNLASMLGPKSEGKNFELLYDVAPAVPVLLVGDPLRLGQVLVNLGNNAVKFTEAGLIKISVNVVDDAAAQTKAEAGPGLVTLRFTVADSGIGMTPQQMDNLFQSFNQADNSTTRKYGGTGLGLAISKTLVEMMHGRIWAESHIGVGSTFVFEVRLGVQKQTPDTSTTQATGLEGRRVLVVDDNRSARDILVAMLHTAGLEVESAAGGDAGLQKAMHAERSGAPFDIVLMDWRMPAMDGIQCAQQLHGLGLARPPAVVLVTAHGYDQAMGQTDGARSVIRSVVVKPVIKSLLLAKMRAVLGSMSADQPTLATTLMESDRQARAIAHLRGSRILLTEDNEVNRELALELFEYAGLQVVLAHHGQEALDILDKDPAFDGILMDCQMPVMDGYTATRHIRSRPPLAAIPVIAMTANAMAGDKDAAVAAGMNDHISKPLDVEKMFVTMARWISPKVRDVPEPAAVQPHTAPVTLPFVDGIDQSIGLRISGGKKALYWRLLSRFAATNADFSSQFHMARQDADPNAAMRCAHTLKGSAANLGIKRVEATALALESACIDAADASHIEALLQKVLAELTPVVAALQAIAGAEPKPRTAMQADAVTFMPASASALEQTSPLTLSAAELLQQLRDQLADDDAQAQDTMRRFLARAAPLPKALETLPAMVENFEFKSALQLLDSAPPLAQP